MKTSKLAATVAVTTLLSFSAAPALATGSTRNANDSGYMSQDLHEVPNAGASVENDAEGNDLLIELYSFTLTDPAATTSEKVIARQELKKTWCTVK